MHLDGAEPTWTPGGPSDAGAPDDEPLTEAELTGLALAVEPGGQPAEDAVPLAAFLGEEPGLLPVWYMPSPMTRIRPRWRTPVVLVVVAAFVAIEAFGLCSTFGQIVPV
jgi:hypothetical protein